ncbi:MAG TPA: hypothetical protein VGB68_02500, partial [Pyrinomonadaceae bacterium]
MKLFKPAIGFFLIFFSFFSNTMNAQTDRFSENYKKFKAFYEKELKDASIIGSSFVFLKDNKIIAQEFYGAANLEKNQKTDANTIY